MRTRSVTSFVRCTLVLAVFAVSGATARVHAQDVTEVTLKSAFLFNFVKFAEWPTDALPQSPTLSACVVGDRAVGDAFARSAKGRPLEGRTILVSILEQSAALPMCQVLYLSGLDRERVTAIIAGLRETPVLTVSDLEGFAAMGGIVEVLVETGKMKFRINPKSAKRAGVQISSRLLALADLVEESVTHPAANGPGVRASAPNRPTRELLHFVAVRSVDWARRMTPWGRQ